MNQTLNNTLDIFNNTLNAEPDVAARILNNILNREQDAELYPGHFFNNTLNPEPDAAGRILNNK